ncbi:MAG: hypothetical protein ACRDMX_07465, partial [Solirubrobacteraceae bacterium]
MTGPLRLAPIAALVAICATVALWSAPAPALALSPSTVCSAGGFFSGLLGKACDVVTNPGRVIAAGKSLLGGHLGSALSDLSGTAVRRAAGTVVRWGAIAAAVATGAHVLIGLALQAAVATTRPDLLAAWFTGPYWRMAAIAALLTLPFLFAAAIQALIRGDLGLLARAAFGWLPLGMLAIGVAAPLTMLLLAASDEMSALVSAAGGTHLLGLAAGAGTFASLATHTPFAAFLIGLLAAGAALTLWIELLVREAAVYVVVLMLPLLFAAMVWPARRIWAARAVELLVALVLAKFAIVAVLSLGAEAVGHGLWSGLQAELAGGTLVLLACFCPWALMRLLPLAELAGAAVGGLSGHGAHAARGVAKSTHAATVGVEQSAPDIVRRLAALSRDGLCTSGGSGGGFDPPGQAAAASSARGGAGDGGDLASGPDDGGPGGGPDGGGGEL